MCSIAEYFYLLFVLWFALQACQNKAQFVYIFKYKWKNQRGRIDSLAPTVLEKQCVLFDSFTYIYSALLPQHWVLYAKVDSTPHLYVCTYIYIYIFFYLSTCALTRKHIAHFFILDPCWQVSNKHLMIIWSIASCQPCISSVHSPTSILRWAGRSRLGPWWWL